VLTRVACVAILLCLSASSAFAQTTTITAVWDRNTDSNTAGYIVYYGTSPGSYQWSLDAGNHVTASLTLPRGAAYFVSVHGYNAENQIGPGSNEESIDLTDGAPTAHLSASLESPTSALVSWQTTNAVSATINGIAVAPSGSTVVPISATTTFTLVAVGASGAIATQQATVNVQPGDAPPSGQISAGLAADWLAQVSWHTVNAVSATINGYPVALSGTAMVPLSAITATFTLVATSATGVTVTDSASTVLNPGAATARITALQIGPGVVRLNWQTAGAVTATLNGTSAPLSGSIDVPISTMTTFTLVAANAVGATATEQVTVTPTPSSAAPPGTPASVTAAVSGSRVTLSWGTPSTGGAPDQYLLYVGTSPGGANILNGVSVGNVLSIAGDVPRGRYYVAVRAANTAGVSDLSDMMVIDVGPILPTPTGFTVTWQGATAIFSWHPPEAGRALEDRPTSYTVEGGTGRGMADIGSVSLGDVSSFQVDVPAGTYYIRLRAVNAFGQSQPTDDVMVARPSP